jgi:hypothetical protein
MATPAAIPVAAPAPTVSAVTSVKLQVVYPAASFTKVQRSLRTQGIPASDLSPEDMRKLTVSINGKVLTSDQYSITDASYDSASNLVVTVELKGIRGAGTLRVATPNDVVVLLVKIGTGTGGTVNVDGDSTADVLLDKALVGQSPASDTDRNNLLDLVKKSVFNLLTSNSSGNVETNSDLNALMQRVRDAVEKKLTLDVDGLQKIAYPPSRGGGGGAPAALAYTIDQLVQGSTTANTAAFQVGQTFLVPTTARLTRVDVWAQARTNPAQLPSDTVVKIYNVVAGIPNGAALATSNTVTVPLVGTMNTFTFAAPATLTGATTYALVVECSGANEVNVGLAGTAPYAGGNLVWNGPAAFTASVGQELTFQAFLTP